MTVNAIDVRLVLTDLNDLLLTETDSVRRIELFGSFLREATDIARNGMFAAMYRLYQEDRWSYFEIAREFDLNKASVARWIQAYARDNDLPIRRRVDRLEGAVRLPFIADGSLRSIRPA